MRSTNDTVHYCSLKKSILTISGKYKEDGYLEYQGNFKEFRMKKFMLLVVVLFVSLILFAGCQKAGGSPASSTPEAIPAYINLDGYRPIVKQGTDVTLKMMVRRDTIAKSDMKNQWMVRYIEQILNIKLDVEETFLDTYQERRNLILASNDLPDMMINMGISAPMMVQYGMSEKMFLPLNDYFSPALTPAILASLQDDPDAVPYSTTPDGKMYTIASFGEETRYPWAETRVFLNTRWMNLAGIREAPTSVDAFLDMMRKFKNFTQAQVGAKDRITPMISANEHDRRYFLNSLGFVGGGTWGADPAIDIKTRKIAIPCGEPEWAEFLRIYNTMYREGLIHPEYFTMAANRATARAHFAEGNSGICADSAAYLSMPNSFQEWISAAPLSSSVNSIRVAEKRADVILGTFVVSSRTRYPEVMLRFTDWLYTPEMGYMSTHGPIAGTPDTLGMVGGLILNAAGDYLTHPDVVSGKYESDYDYRTNAIQLSSETPRNRKGNIINMLKALGVPNPQLREYNLDDGDDHYYVMVSNATNGFFVKVLPPPFLTNQVGTRAADLRSAIANHVMAETAKFIVGQRPLSEIDRYFAELKSMGYDEYKQIYTDIYRDYLAAKTDWQPYRITP
jgi:putative aldouronate transport system substrate-binding protein